MHHQRFWAYPQTALLLQKSWAANVFSLKNLFTISNFRDHLKLVCPPF